MGKSVGYLLAEAQEIMEKRASLRPEAPKSEMVVKLANELRKAPESAEPGTDLTVKVAEAIAIVDTLLNMEEILKVAHFEAKARESGVTDEQITDYIEKKASPKFVSVVSMIPWLNG